MTVTHLPTIPAPENLADHSTERDGKLRPLSGNEFTAVATVSALVAVLALLGFANSFSAVMAAARPSFGDMAWSVPLGIDLGIGIFAALDIVLARLNMRLRWLRLVPWTLTAATIYLNVASEHTAFGQIAHAVLPALWVIAVEVGSHVVRVRAGIEAGTRMDSIRGSRWVLAPWPTLKLWRRMVLWEIRTYPDALSRERARLLALTDLQDAYGRWSWRWKAPRRTRALYRLGELVPAALETGPASGHRGGQNPDTGTATTPDTNTAPRPPRRPAKRPDTKRTGRGGRPADREADALALLTAEPDLSGAELGRRLKVSDRTGRRLHARVTTLLATPEISPATAAVSALEGAPA